MRKDKDAGTRERVRPPAKRPASLIACACLAAFAPLSRADTSAPAVADSAYTNEATIGYSFSSNGDLDRGPKVGSVKINHYDFNDRLEFPVASDLKLMAGVFWSDNELTLSGPVPLPDRLAMLGLQLGATKDLDLLVGPGWSASIFLRPGFYEGGSGFSGRSFDIPGVLMAGYRASSSLSLNLGVAVDARSQYKVLPVVGVRWDFAPDWTLSAGFPETGVSYKVSSDLTVKAGARFQGGSYYVKDALAPGLGDTRLEYREIRVGGGFDYKLLPNLTARIDAGAVVSRRFDYYDRNTTLDGKKAFYASLGLTARF